MSQSPHFTVVFASSVLFLSSVAFAADPPTATSAAPVGKSCRDLTGDAALECERVAARMRQSANSTDANVGNEKGVPVHSSPIMTDAKQKAVAEAQRKGEDPRKAVEKIEAKEKEPAKP
jgi:hypothetical protein